MMGLQSNKNFIVANAVENILCPAKTLPQKVRYTKKRNYGKVPAYLTRIKQNIQSEYKTIREMQQQQNEMYARQQ